MADEYRIDRTRLRRDEVGIFVPVMVDGRRKTADISALDLPSLRLWLRSRGGENLFAERTVALLLGHHPNDITTTWARQALDAIKAAPIGAPLGDLGPLLDRPEPTLTKPMEFYIEPIEQLPIHRLDCDMGADCNCGASSDEDAFDGDDDCDSFGPHDGRHCDCWREGFDCCLCGSPNAEAPDSCSANAP